MRCDCFASKDSRAYAMRAYMAPAVIHSSSNRRRRSIRLPHYDYGESGAYFVTICVHHRECLFGEVVDGSIVLKDLGKIVATEWRRTAEIRPNLTVDEFVVMPNHLHGLLWMEAFRR